MSEEYLTVADVAERLGVSPRAVQKRCVSGSIKAERIEEPKGTWWKIDREEFERTHPRTDERTSELEARNHERNERTGETLGREAANHFSEPANSDSPIHDQEAANIGPNLDANVRTDGREQPKANAVQMARVEGYIARDMERAISQAVAGAIAPIMEKLEAQSEELRELRAMRATLEQIEVNGKPETLAPLIEQVKADSRKEAADALSEVLRPYVEKLDQVARENIELKEQLAAKRPWWRKWGKQ